MSHSAHINAKTFSALPLNHLSYRCITVIIIHIRHTLLTPSWWDTNLQIYLTPNVLCIYHFNSFLYKNIIVPHELSPESIALLQDNLNT